MSRGLGKLQRAILAELARDPGHCSWHGKKWRWLVDLIVHCYHPDRFDPVGNCDSYDYTRSEFVSIHRAIQSLERHGLIETDFDTRGDVYRPNDDIRGGISRLKLLRLADS